MRRARGLLAIGALLALAGCIGRSEEDIQEEFDAFVNGANQCTAASECAAVSPGCPLGCGVAVRTDRKAAVEAKARELIKQYQRGGASCEYECTGHGPVACTGGRCGFEPEP